MTKNYFKQIIFTVFLTVVAVFAYTNVSEAGCFHTYTAATCTEPKTCTLCGDIAERALGHSYTTTSKTVATCTTDGKVVATCNRCGRTQTTTTKALGHSYEITTNISATCTTAGKTVKTCTKCNETQTTTTAKYGHNYKTTTNISATCTTAGKTVVTCTRCNNTQTTTIAKLGHSYKTTTNVAATCTSTGKIEKTCSRCNDSQTVTSLALGHSYKVTTNTSATCTTAGKVVKTCSRCNDTQTSNDAVLGHDYRVTTNIAATCTTSGKIIKTCSRCGDSKSTIIEPKGHKYVIATTEATCTTSGETTQKCSECGHKVTTKEQALGHDYTETTVDATCTTEGKIVKTCSRCDVKVETEIESLGHQSNIVFNENCHWYECDRCDAKIAEEEEHVFDDENVCTICGYYKGVDVEPEDPEEDDDELIIEPWMKENDELNCLAVSLRSEPYEEDRANKNIYALDEKVIYYVDYKNGGKDTNKTVALKLTLPLSFKVIDSDGATVSKSKKTFTWTFDGMENGESGTKVVIVEYTSLGKSSITYKTITPKATIDLGNSQKDVSAVLNLVVKDFDTEIEDEHEPYMYGDRDTGTFRPDDTIRRAEGALVLTRIFGISTKYDENTYAFPDLNETYLEARRAVIAATAYGIIEGYPDGTYRPNKAMTRGEFITILARQIEEEYGEGFEVKDEESLIKVYKDKNRIYYISENEYYNAHWSVSYATLLARLNMTPLTEDSTNLRVDDPITRAEVAQLVNFYLLRAPARITSSTKVSFPDVSKRHKLFADIVEATREEHTYSITDEGTEEEE